MNNWLDVTNDDINRAIAEKIFNWLVFRPSDVKWRSKYDADSYAHSTAYMYLTGKKRPSTHMIDAKLLPRFTEDLNAAFAVQAVAVKKGRNAYLSALHGMVNADGAISDPRIVCITASAKDRCIAALQALGVENQ